MSKKILLIVDVQNALLEANPYNKEIFLSNLKILLSKARQNEIEVIYIQHDGGMGDKFEYGTRGWEIATEIIPGKDDKIISKEKNSAFKRTSLHNYLQVKKVTTIILAGMQTEYCIDASCKSAFDLDYSVIIPRGCTTTFDNDYFSGYDLSLYYENEIWNNRYAQVVSIDESINM